MNPIKPRLFQGRLDRSERVGLGHRQQSPVQSRRAFFPFRDQRCASVPASQQNVLSLVDVLAAHQFGDQDFVERWLSLEVECFQRFVCRELRGFEALFGSTAFAINQFQFAELQQVRQVVDVFCCATIRNLLAFTLNGRKLQRFEVMLKQDSTFCFGLLHSFPPIIRDW
jgi:hypothetical protein